MSYYYPVQVHLETSAATAGSQTICFHERMEVVGVKLVDTAGIAADASNYATFQVLGNDQTTVLVEWKTQTGEDGALTANTSVNMVSQGNEDKAIFDAGEALVVKVLKASSGKATNANVCLQLRQARSY